MKVAVLPDTVTTVEAHSFDGCNNMVRIVLPAGLESIEENAFINCSSLVEVVFPSTLRRIGDAAFAKCGKLERVILPPGMQTAMKWFGNNVFDGCDMLAAQPPPAALGAAPGLDGRNWTHSNDGSGGRDGGGGGVGGGDSGATHGNATDSGCTSTGKGNGSSTSADVVDVTRGWEVHLTEEDFAGNAVTDTIAEEEFVDRLDIISVVLTDTTITTIEPNAFKGCANLRSIKLPQHLQVVGHAAFLGCSSIAAIDFPPTVSEIGGNAFWGCKKLATLGYAAANLKTTLKVFGAGAFDGCARSVCNSAAILNDFKVHLTAEDVAACVVAALPVHAATAADADDDDDDEGSLRTAEWPTNAGSNRVDIAAAVPRAEYKNRQDIKSIILQVK